MCPRRMAPFRHHDLEGKRTNRSLMFRRIPNARVSNGYVKFGSPSSSQLKIHPCHTSLPPIGRSFDACLSGPSFAASATAAATPNCSRKHTCGDGAPRAIRARPSSTQPGEKSRNTTWAGHQRSSADPLNALGPHSRFIAGNRGHGLAADHDGDIRPHRGLQLSPASVKGPPEPVFCHGHGTTSLPVMGPPGVS